MNRRRFTKQTGLVLAAATLPMQVFPFSDKKNYKMGFQLFSIRDAIAADLQGSLAKVAGAGFEDVETYGFDPKNGTYYGHKTADFKSILEDHGLTASSGHYGFSDYFDQSRDKMSAYVDACIGAAKTLGKSYITWPWLAPEQRSIDQFKRLSLKLNQIGEQVTKAGLGFAYHNHNFEFIEQDGEIGYDIIIKETDPALVKLQMDLYWVHNASKLTPSEWIAKQPGRFVMWHIKDMDKQTRDYTEVGNGSIDFTQTLPLAERAGVEFYYLEQGGNYAQNSIQSMIDSASYFKQNLKKYL